MKPSIAIAIAVAGALAAGLANAQSGADVLKAKGCMNCHDVDKKKLGPSFKDVAAKYKGDPKAEDAIVARLKEGKGHPKSDASEAELKAAVSHMLGAR
jgi:cytochrome c